MISEFQLIEAKKIVDQNFDYFLSYINTIAKSFGWRYGQALYNFLDMVKPDLASEIVGTHLDPFYKDNNSSLEKIIEFLRLRWNE